MKKLVLSPKYGENKYLLYRHTMTTSEITTHNLKEMDALHCEILRKNVVLAMETEFFCQIFKKLQRENLLTRNSDTQIKWLEVKVVHYMVKGLIS